MIPFLLYDENEKEITSKRGLRDVDAKFM